ncbi:unnamed protein product [Cylindrotheca closterium]|uniref:Zinc finger C2HC5-type domain-containing protein n=1 Tax=Cylindrotheca closterium TaxID=2856 RepID=A0AAD2CZC3_9STRA|nr:unnamed protein product [Cylindrotheca closterium]
MSQEGKFLLESILGKLLGFDEGAGDLLEHLLTIPSEEDLKEYLSQLLGSETPETKEFVLNVGRYQRGEEVLYKIEKKEEQKEEESAKAQSSQVAQTNNAASTGTNNANAKQNKKEALQARRNNNNPKQGKKGKVPPSAKNATAAQTSNSQSAAAAASSTATKPTPTTAQSAGTSSTPPAASITTPITPIVQKSKPQRGKAEFVCGCMGTRDKPLTNCLYCGRIACEREGYGYCAYCGYLIEKMTAPPAGSDNSWAQKERLLKFDREFARRTKIFDDQADFQGPASWMSEEERVAAGQRQEDRLEEMRRPKQVLNLNI